MNKERMRELIKFYWGSTDPKEEIKKRLEQSPNDEHLKKYLLMLDELEKDENRDSNKAE